MERSAREGNVDVLTDVILAYDAAGHVFAIFSETPTIATILPAAARDAFIPPILSTSPVVSAALCRPLAAQSSSPAAGRVRCGWRFASRGVRAQICRSAVWCGRS